MAPFNTKQYLDLYKPVENIKRWQSGFWNPGSATAHRVAVAMKDLGANDGFVNMKQWVWSKLV